MIKIIIIILILLFFISKQIKSTKTIENFITWYLPFYNKSTLELTNNTPAYLTSNLELNYLKYDTFNTINVYILKKNIYYDFNFENILKNTKINKLFLHNNDTSFDILKNVNDNINNLGILSSIFLVNNVYNISNNAKNINFVINSNYKYIFFIVNEFSKISKLSEINNKKINIGSKYSDENYFGKNIIQNLNNKYGIYPKKILEYNNDDSFKKLKNGEIDGMIYTDTFISEILNKKLNNITGKLILIPIEDINDKIFTERHPFIEKVSLDQNYLPKNYLPIKIKDLYYNKFRPDLTSYKYPNVIICNKDASPKLIYNIIKSISSNLDTINNSKFVLENYWNYLSFPNISTNYIIPNHIGANLFYEKITVNTTYSDNLCKYYVGNAKCTPEKIEGARIISDNTI